MRKAASLLLIFALGILMAQDTEPPRVDNMDPENGATGVAADATITFEILDESDIDIESISIMIMGFDVTAFISPSEIVGGLRYTYSAPMDLPDGENTIYISACDEYDNCLTRFEYSFTVSGGVEYYGVSGTATLEGETDHSGITIAVVDGDEEILTDSTGLYLLVLPDVGEYDIYAAKDGYIDSPPVTVDITSDTPLVGDIDFLLEPDTTGSFTLSGFITLEGETDHSGTEVMLDMSESMTTAADGAYEFTGLSEGRHIIYATPPTREWHAITDTIEVTSDTDYSTELPLAGPTPPGPPQNIVAREGYLNFIYVQWEEPLPEGIYELGYDDGVPDSGPDIGTYTHIGFGGLPDKEWGVQFTPPVPGCELVLAKYDFNVHGNTNVDIRIRDIVADTPADVLIPAFTAVIDTLVEWTEVEIGLDLEDDDDFYIGFRDVVEGTDTSAVYIGCDKSDPNFRSWYYWDEWDLVNHHTHPGLNITDLMIRAVIRLPDGLYRELEPTRPEPRLTTGIDSPSPVYEVCRTLTMNDSNPFTDGEFETVEDIYSYRKTPRNPLMRTLETMDVTEYRIFRNDVPFSDTTDAEFLASRPYDSLFYYDRDLEGIEPNEWMFYGVVAVGEGGASDLGNIDSGYYVDYGDTTADVLIVDLTADRMLADEGTMNEAEWWEDMLTEHDITVARTNVGESFYRFPMEHYDALFICLGNSSPGRIDLLEDEFYDIMEYIELGGHVYLEGSIAALRAELEGPPYSNYFHRFWGYYFDEDVWGHSSDTGNVIWCESVDLFFENTYLRLNYEPFSDADWRCSQLQARADADIIFQSQPDGEMGVPVQFSRGRSVYKEHDSGGTTVFSSVYLGAFHDGAEPYTRENLVRGILIAFDFVIEGMEENPFFPVTNALIEATPNPFNSACRISIPDGYEAAIYDIKGQEVEKLIPGTSTWNAEDHPSGLYLIKTTNGDHTKRISLIK